MRTTSKDCLYFTIETVVFFSFKEFAMNDVNVQADPLFKAVESLFEKIFVIGEEMGYQRKDIFPPTPYEDWGKSFEVQDDW